MFLVRFRISLPADQVLGPGGRPMVAISPDGTQVVYEANQALWLRTLDQLQAVQMEGTEQEQMPFFSADGQSIGFWANGQLKRVAVSGGAPVTLAGGVSNPRGASWGADDVIVYSQDSGIMQMPGTGGSPQLLIPAHEDENLVAPQMLPGDEWVLLSVPASRSTQSQIVAHSVITGERLVLVDGGSNGVYLSTGHLVYGFNNGLLAVPFDVDSVATTGGPVPLVEGLRQGQSFGVVHFAVSASGSLVYVPATGDDVVTLTWVTRDGSEEALPMPSRQYDTPRVSPDGTRIAVDITEGDTSNVWIWDLTRERLIPLTFDEATDNTPLWTPDSAHVVFGSTRDGGGLFWKAADGTGQVERLTDGTGRPYAWTADQHLIYQRFGNIAVLAGENDVTMLLDEEYPEIAPALSPDAQWLAYESRETGTPNIMVRPFPNVDDGRWNVSVDYGAHPVWSPDA